MARPIQEFKIPPGDILTHVAAIAGQIQIELEARPSDSFSHAYLLQAVTIYATEAEKILAKLRGKGFSVLSLLSYLTSDNPLHAISSNGLPFVFLPEKRDGTIRLCFSEQSYELLKKLQDLISKIDIEKVHERIRAHILDRQKKIDTKIQLAKQYKNAKDEYDAAQTLVQSKLELLEHLKPCQSPLDIIDSALNTLATSPSQFLAPYREQLKEELEGHPKKFKNKHNAFFAGIVTRYFGADQIDAISQAFTLTPLQAAFDLKPDLERLAKAIVKILDITKEHYTDEVLSEHKRRLEEACVKHNMTLSKKIDLSSALAFTEIKDMDSYIRNFVTAFFRLLLLFANTLPSEAIIQTFVATAFNYILKLARALDPSQKKYQHESAKQSVALFYRELKELLGFLSEHSHESDFHACVFQYACAVATKLRTHTDPPQDEYKKPASSKVKSALTHRLGIMAAKPATQFDEEITSSAANQFSYVCTHLLGKTPLGIQDRSFHIVIGLCDMLTEHTLTLAQAQLSHSTQEQRQNNLARAANGYYCCFNHISLFSDFRAEELIDTGEKLRIAALLAQHAKVIKTAAQDHRCSVFLQPQ